MLDIRDVDPLELPPTTVQAALPTGNLQTTPRWNIGDPLGTPVTLTYCFSDLPPSYQIDSYGYTPQSAVVWSAAQKAALAQVFAGYASVSGLSFQLVANAASADITLFLASSLTDAAAFANYPGDADTNGDVFGDVFFDVNAFPADGSNLYLAYHEVGHALGIAHLYDGGKPTIEDLGFDGSRVLSVVDQRMPERAYFLHGDENSGGIGSVFNPSGPMLLDVAALQGLYGARLEANAGNTTYSFPVSLNDYRCIWDGSGTDGIDVSNQAYPCLVSLVEGSFSTIGYRDPFDGFPGWLTDWAAGLSIPESAYIDGRDLVSIAFGAVIENAIGSSQADILVGNAAANRLDGGVGNDTLTGAAGNDSLVGGAGNDSLDGGSAVDVAIYTGARAQYTITSLGGVFTIVSIAEGTDVLVDVEFAQFTDQTVALGAADVTAPTVTITDQTPGTATGAVTYGLSFDEPVTGLAANDFVVTNGSVTSVSGAGANYTVVVIPTSSFEGSMGLQLLAGAVIDAAGNPNLVASAAARAVDTKAPTATFSPADEATGVAVGSNVVVTFSEAVQRGVGNIVLKTAAGAVVETYNAATSGNLSVSGTQLTIDPTVLLANSTQFKIEIEAGSIRDLAGNAYAGTVDYSFTTTAAADTTSPTVTITDNSPGTATGNVTYTLAFSEIVAGLAANDFQATNGSVTSVSGSGANYTVVVTPTANFEGSMGLQLLAGAVIDAAGNPNLVASAAAQAVDTWAPTATFNPASGAAGVATGANVVVTFSEAVQRGVGNIVLKTAAGAIIETYSVATSGNLSVSGAQLTIDPTVLLANSTQYKIEIEAGSIRDLAGNAYAGTVDYSFTTTAAADTTPPTVTITDNSPGTATGSVTYTLAFSEIVAGLAANDFHASNGSVTSVSGSGANYTVVVTPTANFEGSMGLQLLAGAVIDAAGNPNLVASAAAQAVDTWAPTATFNPASGAAGVAIGANVVVTFSEAVQRGVGNIVLKTAAGAIIETYSVATSGNLSVSGAQLTIDPTVLLANSTQYKIQIEAGSIRDLAGNAYAGTTSFNFTTAAVAGIMGGPGGDLLNGTAADELIDGGAGRDTLVYPGNLANYSMFRSADNFVVLGPGGTDTLLNVERLRFDNFNVALDVQGNAGQAYRLYQAAFDRTPDIGGLGFQINALDIGFALTDISANFIESPEFTSRYGSLGNSQFVTQLYLNVLDRAPDAGGLTFHVTNLEAGLPRSYLLAQFSESPENQANVIGAIENGMLYLL